MMKCERCSEYIVSDAYYTNARDPEFPEDRYFCGYCRGEIYPTDEDFSAWANEEVEHGSKTND